MIQLSKWPLISSKLHKRTLIRRWVIKNLQWNSNFTWKTMCYSMIVRKRHCLSAYKISFKEHISNLGMKLKIKIMSLKVQQVFRRSMIVWRLLESILSISARTLPILSIIVRWDIPNHCMKFSIKILSMSFKKGLVLIMISHPYGKTNSRIFYLKIIIIQQLMMKGRIVIVPNLHRL